MCELVSYMELSSESEFYFLIRARNYITGLISVISPFSWHSSKSLVDMSYIYSARISHDVISIIEATQSLIQWDVLTRVKSIHQPKQNNSQSYTSFFDFLHGEESLERAYFSSWSPNTLSHILFICLTIYLEENTFNEIF